MVTIKKYINATIYGDPKSREFIVGNGAFKAIGNHLENADEVIDLEGRLVLPPYVDPHLHLDYIFSGLGEGNANVSGTLFEGIQRWSDHKKSLTEEMVRERAEVLASIRNGKYLFKRQVRKNEIEVDFLIQS